MVVVGNETVAEDTLPDGEKKAVAVAEVELADVDLKRERHVTGLCTLTENVACCLARDSTTFYPSINLKFGLL